METRRRALMVSATASQRADGRAATTRAASVRAWSAGRLAVLSSTRTSASGRAVVSVSRSAPGPRIQSRSAGSLPWGELCVGGVPAVRREQPVGPFGSDSPGEVGVGGHDRVSAEAAELGGLVVGQGGAQGGYPEVAAAGRDGHGDRVHGA